MKVIFLMIALTISAFAQDAKQGEQKPQQQAPSPQTTLGKELQNQTAKPEPRFVPLSAEQQAPLINLIKERDEVYQQYQLRIDGALVMLKSMLGLDGGCTPEVTPENVIRFKCPPKPEAKPKP